MFSQESLNKWGNLSLIICLFAVAFGFVSFGVNMFRMPEQARKGMKNTYQEMGVRINKLQADLNNQKKQTESLRNRVMAIEGIQFFGKETEKVSNGPEVANNI